MMPREDQVEWYVLFGKQLGTLGAILLSILCAQIAIVTLLVLILVEMK